MTCSQILVEHCLATSAELPLQQRVVLLRALAVEISDRALSTNCRQIASDLETTEQKQQQLLLNLRSARAA